MKGKDKSKDVIWDALGETIQWMKSVTGVWGRHHPFVVRFVKSFVDQWMMQTSMDPVDAHICKGDEEWELEVCIPPSWSLLGTVVQFGISSYFG